MAAVSFGVPITSPLGKRTPCFLSLSPLADSLGKRTVGKRSERRTPARGSTHARLRTSARTHTHKTPETKETRRTWASPAGPAAAARKLSGSQRTKQRRGGEPLGLGQRLGQGRQAPRPFGRVGAPQACGPASGRSRDLQNLRDLRDLDLAISIIRAKPRSRTSPRSPRSARSRADRRHPPPRAGQTLAAPRRPRRRLPAGEVREKPGAKVARRDARKVLRRGRRRGRRRARVCVVVVVGGGGLAAESVN